MSTAPGNRNVTARPIVSTPDVTRLPWHTGQRAPLSLPRPAGLLAALSNPRRSRSRP